MLSKCSTKETLNCSNKLPKHRKMGDMSLQECDAGVQCHVLVRDSLCLRGAWGAQLVKHPTSAQVMISLFVGSTKCQALC